MNKCLNCFKAFNPSKFKPDQMYCSKKCWDRKHKRWLIPKRKLYSLLYNRGWRKEHPSYMSDYWHNVAKNK